MTDRIAGLRRHAWLIVAVALLAGAAAAVIALLQPTTFTARAVLTTSSSNRSPEQDAYLAQGYAAFFNTASYQERSAARLPLPPGLVLSASTSTNSPIVYVQVAGSDPAVAEATASALATVLRDDVNGGLQGDVADRVRRIQDQVDLLRVRLDLPIATAERDQIAQSINSLQIQMATIRADTTNQLKVLQLDGGVERSDPRVVINGLYGLVGGLFAGVLVALALGVWRVRIRTAADVRDQLGLETLGVVTRQDRRGQLPGMVSLLSLRDLPSPVTIAVTGVASASAASAVAERLAVGWSAHHGRTVLVRGGAIGLDRPDPDATGPGLLDLLAGDGRIGPDEVLGPAAGRDLAVLGAGRPVEDSALLVTRRRLAPVLDGLRRHRAAVVVAAPCVADAVEASVFCACADRTVLVVEEGRTLGTDATETLRSLRQVGADVLGVVIVPRGWSPEAPVVRPALPAPDPVTGPLGGAAHRHGPRPMPRPLPDKGIDIRG